jgi:DNA polymerase III epsilon subunit family exonuclease
VIGRRPGSLPPRDHGGDPPWAGRAGSVATAPPPWVLPPGWRDSEYLALDFETTGLDPALERIVEIGALRFCIAGTELREEATLASLANPGKSMPAVAAAVHGLGDDDVEGAPSFPELAPALLALARDAIIVAHNAPFDLSFLRSELALCGLEAGWFRAIDTRAAAKSAFPALRSYRLGDLATELGIDRGSAHRALDDARTCAHLLLACALRLEAAAAGA